MNIIYTLLIIIVTLFINASVTWAMPYVKTKYKTFITRIKRVPTPKSQVDCSLLETRVQVLEKKLEKRQENYRKAMREEIKNFLS